MHILFGFCLRPSFKVNHTSFNAMFADVQQMLTQMEMLSKFTFKY